MASHAGNRASPPTAFVVGTAPRVAITVARSLARRGIRVTAAPSSSDEGPLLTSAIHNYVALPDPETDPAGFDDRFEQAVSASGARLLLPCSDAALAAITRNYDRLKALADPGCPPPAIAMRVLDKNATLSAARSLGIDVPATVDESASHKRIDPATLHYPVIAKPRDHAARGRYRIRYFEDRSALGEALEADPGFESRFLVQQFVTGYGVGVAVLVHDGRAIASFVHRRLKELPAAGGVSVVAESMAPEPALVDKALALLQALAWEGVALVEFRRDPSGTDWLMEVNGRYWGSLPVAAAAGVDFPYYQWQSAIGETPTPPASYPAGVKVRWTRGDVARLRERLFERPGFGLDRGRPADEWRSFLRDFRSDVRSALWSGVDPLPAIADPLPAVARFFGAAVASGAKALVPRQLLRARRRLGTAGAIQYAWFATMSALGLRSLRLRRPFTPRSVLFVCSGNIMRSALAAAVFADALRRRGIDGIEAASSGLHARAGTPADVRAIAAARAAGVTIDAHRATTMDQALASRFDAIVVMDRLQELELIRRFPASARKTYVLGACLPGSPMVDIPDPYLEKPETCERILSVVRERANALGDAVADDVRGRAGAGGAAATPSAT